jgi:lipopolysaccharide/colanic/teichoic acid biosynthesis glycosyltransferase
VLKGDLSLVGPHPELIKRFREEILYYSARHNIIPGMTDWAQVNGFRGDTYLNERILDSYFIENDPRLSDHVYDLLPLGRSTLSSSVDP